MTRKQALEIALTTLQRQEDVYRFSPVLVLNDPRDLDNPDLHPSRIVNLKDKQQAIEETQKAFQVLHRWYKAEE